MTRVINAAHADGTRVVLTVTRLRLDDEPGHASRRRSSAAAPPAPPSPARSSRRCAIAAPTASTSTSSRSRRGYADEFVSLLRTIRSEFNRVRSGYQITYDTTAYIGNYPLEASVGKRAADAIFVMGYDFRHRQLVDRRAPSRRCRAPATTWRTRSGRTSARVPGSRLILGIPWYGRAWSTATDKPRSRTLSGAKYGVQPRGELRERHGLRARVRPALGQGRAEPVRRLPPPELHEDLRLRHELAPGLVRGRDVDEAPLRARQRLRPARRRHVGAGLRGRPERAVPGARRLVPRRDTSAPHRRRQPAVRQPGRRGVHRQAGSARAAARSPPTTSRSRPTAAPWRAWRTKTKATSDVFLGRTGVGYAFRVRAATRGHAGAVERSASRRRCDASPSIRVGRVRPGAPRRARLPGRPDTLGHGSGRSTAARSSRSRGAP